MLRSLPSQRQMKGTLSRAPTVIIIITTITTIITTTITTGRQSPVVAWLAHLAKSSNLLQQLYHRRHPSMSAMLLYARFAMSTAWHQWLPSDRLASRHSRHLLRRLCHHRNLDLHRSGPTRSWALTAVRGVDPRLDIRIQLLTLTISSETMRSQTSPQPIQRCPEPEKFRLLSTSRTSQWKRVKIFWQALLPLN